MASPRVNNLRDVPEVPLAVLFGAGVVGLLSFSYMLFTRTRLIGGVIPEHFVEVLILGVPATGLLYAGFWLATGDFTPAEIWDIGSYAVAGVVATGVGVSLSLLAVSVSGVGLRDAFLLYVGTGTEGAFIGMLIGVVHVTDCLHRDIASSQRERSDLARENDRLEAFAGVVSHDLRNPLNVAQGRVELAREEYECDHLEAAQHAHERMETLIEDLLMLARYGEAVTDPESVALAEVVECCWTNVPTENATLVVDVEGSIKADPNRLQQLLENLFRNAIEHGGDDVTVRVGDLTSGFYVEDDGPGIPADARDDVFTAGYSTSHDGAGFGLNIVQEIVEAHGWAVSVTAGTEGGARFEITGCDD